LKQNGLSWMIEEARIQRGNLTFSKKL